MCKIFIFMCSNNIKHHDMKQGLNCIISKILQIIKQMYCLWYQNIDILLGYVLISNRRDTAI